MNQIHHIDINADVGEGIGNEATILQLLSSCNIACGGHAGDLQTMSKVVKLAKQHNVKIGAHPSFPDIANFGRVEMTISPVDLYDSLKHQIQALQNVVNSEHAQLYHIKPHGALYNLAAKDEKTAAIIIDVLKSINLPLKLYAPYNSVIAKLAKRTHIEIVVEAFVDRNYNKDLSLVSRTNTNALLTDKYLILKHVLNMIKSNKVHTICGVDVPIKASTFCVHGDSENAVEILKFLNEELPNHKVQIQY